MIEKVAPRVSPAEALQQQVRQQLDRHTGAPRAVLESLLAYVAQQEAERARIIAMLGLLASLALTDGRGRTPMQDDALAAMKAWAAGELQ